MDDAEEADRDAQAEALRHAPDEPTAADVLETVEEVRAQISRLDSRIWLLALAWSSIAGCWLLRHW